MLKYCARKKESDEKFSTYSMFINDVTDIALRYGQVKMSVQNVNSPEEDPV
jgi:hypothetical protein